MMIRRNRLMQTASVLPALCLLLSAATVHATTYSDRGAAIVVLPKIVVDVDNGVDTLIQLSNASQTQRIAAHCFYVNANYHCSNSGDVCVPGDSTACVDGAFTGACVPGWIELDFNVVLTADQPLAWQASEGLRGSEFPCPIDGICQPPTGGGIQSNAGGRVPPVPERQFIGELKCIQVDVGEFRPTNANDLEASATIERTAFGPDPAKYNGVGIRTINAGPNQDGELIIGPSGSSDAEYEACAASLVVNHLFDDAEDPIASGDGGFRARSELTLVPCSQDFLTQQLAAVTAQFLVYNEFEQRFSTSRQVRCLLDSQLSLIDTSQPDRSIFNAGVTGTVAGSTRITGVNGGLIGVLIYNAGTGATDPNTGLPIPAAQRSEGGAGMNVHQQGEQSTESRIRIL
jgi:hypothetical protein